MTSLDSFFTPVGISESIVLLAKPPNPPIVADFAAGDGALLLAAVKRWPRLRVIATDISPACVRRLKENHPEWVVGKCDFTRSESRRRSSAVTEFAGQIGLVLLNPPFSCRGGTVSRVWLANEEVECSRAMAFVLMSLPLLADCGQIVALLPAGCISSEKDSGARSVLRACGKFEVVQHYEFGTFDGVHARTVVIRFAKAAQKAIRQSVIGGSKSIADACEENQVVRGTIQAHTVPHLRSDGGEYAFVHTTNMREGELLLNHLKVSTNRSIFLGPGVLIPRVGEPSRSKCVVFRKRQAIVLSDCVIGIKCKTTREAELLRRRFMLNWSRVKRSYGGTCAKYITLGELQQILKYFQLKDGNGDGRKSPGN